MSTPVASFLSGRAQMERERLERLKRIRGQDADDGGHISPPAAKRQQISSGSASEILAPSSLNMIPSGSSESSGVATSESLSLFWNGELRPTANKHSQPRQDGKPTFSLTEVLGLKSHISFAIIASHSTSVSWIYDFFAPSTPVIFVSQPDQSGQPAIKNILPNWVTTVPFLRNGRGCQHMKFMLIFYKTGRLRVVISTANLIEYEWRDIENAVWLQDLPPRSASIPPDLKVVDDFPSVMQNVLCAVNVRPALANMMANDHPNLPLRTIGDLRKKWDWSKVKVKLVPSIAGRHEGWPDVILTGHTRLMTAVRDMGLRTGQGKAAKDLVIECQGSSVGTYSTQWINEFYWSARGEFAHDWLDEPKTTRAELPWPPVKVIFPSLKTVHDSVFGEQGGGTTFCSTKQWEGSKFPRELFHDSNSAGGRVLMNTKMIIATHCPKKSICEKGSPETEPESDDIEILNDPIGWAYVGSHNFTPSAWGMLSGSGLNPVLDVANYELGIILPLYDAKDAEKVACFKRPARKYVNGQDRPWIQEESQLLRQSQQT